jgi:hypothetical protein
VKTNILVALLQKKDRISVCHSPVQTGAHLELEQPGCSIGLTYIIVNHHQEQNELPSYTNAAVYGSLKRLNPLVSCVKMMKTGSCDPGSKLSRARKLFSAQLLIRFGEKIDIPVDPITGSDSRLL